MKQYRLLKEAVDDLSSIWNYIAQDSIDAADRWLDELHESISALAKSPRMGHTRHDLTSRAVRFWPVGAYLIIYRSLGDVIEIVAITHGARDIPNFLRERSR